MSQGILWGVPAVAQEESKTLTYTQLLEAVETGKLSCIEYDPVRNVALIHYKDSPAGNPTSGSQTSDGRASGSQASVDQASVDRTSINQTNQASDRQTSSDQASGSQTSGSQAASKPTSGNQASGDQASGDQASGHPTSGSQAASKPTSDSQASDSQALDSQASDSQALDSQVSSSSTRNQASLDTAESSDTSDTTESSPSKSADTVSPEDNSAQASEAQRRCPKPLETVPLFEQSPELIEVALAHDVAFITRPTADNRTILNLVAQLLVFVILFSALVIIVRRSTNAANQAMNFGKSRARFQMEAKTGVLFEDVAGIEEAKEELQEVVTFLKKPERFTTIGAKIPKGVLLVGPPGTGKTLLARAIAGEAAVPFFSISGSEFVEMFVGVGASRVRDLFRKAKENSPCIVFIDEIDAVGRQRGVGIGGGNDEREQTLNQLLTEMDGFEDNSGIIVIAATNRPDVLDTALLRPGRFDRQVALDLPNFKGREGILKVHVRDKKIDASISLESIARRTPGFSGADLANLLNEAAILTARRRKAEIGMAEIQDAIDRVTVGTRLSPLLDSKKKRLIAYHEVGHALLMTLLKHSDRLDKVTIIPRSGGVGGYAKPIPDEEILDSGMYTRAWLIDRMIVLMGGRAAETVIFGPDEVTPGAMSDIQQLTELARNMVTRYGMSDLGPLSLNSETGELFLGRDMLMSRHDYSEAMALKIDLQIRTIAQYCYGEAKNLIEKYRSLMDELVDLLLEQEEIDGDEFRKRVSQVTPLPDAPFLGKAATVPIAASVPSPAVATPA